MQRHVQRGAPCEALLGGEVSPLASDDLGNEDFSTHPKTKNPKRHDEKEYWDQEPPVKAHAYGSETMDHLTLAFKTQCARRTDKGFVELVEKMFFDPERPENRTLRARNLKNNIVQVFDGRAWMHHRKQDIVSDLFERGRAVLMEHYEEHEGLVNQNLSATMRHHVRDWMEALEDRDRKTAASLESSLFLLVLNKTPRGAFHRSPKSEIG